MIRAHSVVNGVQINVGVDSSDPESLRRAYLHHLLKNAGKLSLAGIDPKAASEAEAQLNLGAVYTGLLTLTPEECDHLTRENCLPERMARGERRRSALAHLDREPRLVLLGDPGSGKSTFVNFVALCLAGEALGRDDANLARLREPLPRIGGRTRTRNPSRSPGATARCCRCASCCATSPRAACRRWEPADADTLWDFIVAELGEALADFAPPSSATCTRRRPAAAGRPGRGARSRTAPHADQAGGGGLRGDLPPVPHPGHQPHLRLPAAGLAADGLQRSRAGALRAGQIRRFVDRWYAHMAEVRHLDAEDAQGRAELLKRAIFNSERLQGLAARPLLLTLMASLHAWRGGSLPEKREELYADTVDLLLDWWESPRWCATPGGEFVIQQPSLAEWLKVDREKVRRCSSGWPTRPTEQAEACGHGGRAGRRLLVGLLALSQNPDVKPGGWWST